MSDLSTLFSSEEIFQIMGIDYVEEDYVSIDCSVRVPALQGVVDYDRLDDYVRSVKGQAAAKVAIGGYLEHRNLYGSSEHFQSGTSRDRHLGIDLWVDAGHPVYAPVSGHVHSYAYNDAHLDYGYTLIIEHRVGEKRCYTLYGHLSSEYHDRWQIGQPIHVGQQVATVGDQSENGGWVPHLHFQLIRDMGDQEGDYPGVCTAEDLEQYSANCPDPSFLIKKCQ